MRFVHTADWQLGMTRYFLNGEAQPRYSAARRDVVAGLGPLAAETGAEFVVVAGDVFEHNQLTPRVVSQSLEAMRAIGVPGLPAAGQPRSARRVVGVHQRTVHHRMPGQRHGSRPARRARGAAGPGDRGSTVDVEGAHHRPRRGGDRRPARRRDHPHRRRPRRCRHLRAGQGQAVADNARGPRSRHRPRRGALCRVGRQALSHAGRHVRPDLVLRIARGHQLRRHRARPRSRVGGRRRRGRSGPPGECRRATGGPLAVRDAAPLGGQQPRHRRPRHQPRPDARQGAHRRSAGADRIVDGDRQGRARCLPRQVRAAVRGAGAVGAADRDRGDPRRRRVRRPRHRRFRRRRCRRTGGRRRAPTASDADDARAALSLLLRLVDRGVA